MLANDGDADEGDDIAPAAHSFKTAQGVTVSFDAEGRFNYQAPAGFVGTDTFRYWIDDGQAMSNAATVSIRVGNRPPTAAVDEFTVITGETLRFSPQTLIGNDSDIDGDTVAFDALRSHAAHGCLTWRNDGTFEYVAAPGFVGEDEFRYRITDGESVAEGTVKIHVVAPPPPVALSIDDAVVDEGAGTATIMFRLNRADHGGVTVDYTTNDFTAYSGSDYAGTIGQVNITPGQTEASITVGLYDDGDDESDEQFTVDVTNVSGAELIDGQALVTIQDNDETPPPPPPPPPPPVSLSVDDATVDESVGSVTVTFRLDHGDHGGVWVSYATNDASASSYSDYSGTSGQAYIAPGQTETSISVALNDDADEESDEQFTVDVTSYSGADLADGQGLVTIQDNDEIEPPPPPPPPPVSLSIDDATVHEAAGSVTVTLRLNHGDHGGVWVSYATNDGSASSSSDYTGTSGDLYFSPGQTEASFGVSVNDDTDDESDEQFTVDVISYSGADLADGQALVTIQDNDEIEPPPPPPPPVSLSVDDATVHEAAGSVNVTLRLNHGDHSGVWVSYATNDASAASYSDYAATSGDLYFSPGQTEASFSVSVNDDTDDESDEQFTVDVTSLSGADLADGQALVTIQDNDEIELPPPPPPPPPPPSVTVTSGAGTIDEGGSYTLELSIAADPASDLSYTIDWGDGQQTAGTLSAGTTTLSLAHDYFDDDPTATPSDDYSVSVSVVDSSGQSAADATTVTVNNVAPTITLDNNSTSVNEAAGPIVVSGRVDDVGVADLITVIISVNGVDVSTQTIAAGGTFSYSHDQDDDDLDPADDSEDGPTGTLNIQVRAVDDDGGESQKSLTATIHNVAPGGGVTTAHAGEFDPDAPPTAADILAAAEGAVSDPGSDVLRYELLSPLNSLLGDYTASVKVLDDDGGSTTISVGYTVAYQYENVYAVHVATDEEVEWGEWSYSLQLELVEDEFMLDSEGFVIDPASVFANDEPAKLMRSKNNLIRTTHHYEEYGTRHGEEVMIRTYSETSTQDGEGITEEVEGANISMTVSPGNPPEFAKTTPAWTIDYGGNFRYEQEVDETEGVRDDQFTYLLTAACDDPAHPGETLVAQASGTVTLSKGIQIQAWTTSGGILAQNKMRTEGAFVIENNDDDDYNRRMDKLDVISADETDLLKLTVPPLSKGNKYAIEISNRAIINLYKRGPNGQDYVRVNDGDFEDDTYAGEFFIEGLDIGDTELTVRHLQPGKQTHDTLKITVVRVTGALNVPGHGTYEYRVEKAVGTPVGEWVNPEKAKPINPADAAMNAIDLTWLNEATIGHVKYKASSQYTLSYDVNVVKITVEEPDGDNAIINSADPELRGSSLTLAGYPIHNREGAGGPELHLLSAPSGVHAIDASAKITLEGAGPNKTRGIDDIQVGFIQTLVSYKSRGTYDFGQTIHTSIDGMGPISDRDGTSPFWYSGSLGATFRGVSQQQMPQRVGTITMFDTPTTFMLAYWETDENLLSYWTVEYSFTLDVAVRTEGAPDRFTTFATADWSLDMSGVLMDGVWIHTGGGLAAPDNWTSTAPRAPAKVGGESARDRALDTLSGDKSYHLL